MLRRSWISVCSTIAVICFALGVLLQVLSLTHLACWCIVGAGIPCVILIFPASLKRMSPSNNWVHNLLILLSTMIFTGCLIFVMVALSYYGLFDKQLLSFFDVVFYPCTLAYAILELVIDYYHRDKKHPFTFDIHEK